MRAYVFPGQGVQRKGMGRDLFPQFPDLCRTADEILGYSIVDLCLTDPSRLLNRTEYAQPAIYVVNALHHLTVTPADYLAGHSLGEYNALLAAGTFDFATGLRLVQRRSSLMAEAGDGSMAAIIGLPEEEIFNVLHTNASPTVAIANHNAPTQYVISGTRAEITHLRPLFETLGATYIPLRVSGAFHSPHMSQAAEAYRHFLTSIPLTPPQTPVISNVTATPHPPNPNAIRAALANHLTHPVRWSDTIHHLRTAGVTTFVELGNSTVLTTLIDKTPPTPHQALITKIREDVLHPLIGDKALTFPETHSFRHLGLDSIIYIRIARKVESVFNIPCKPDTIHTTRTCTALADYLLAHQSPQTPTPTPTPTPTSTPTPFQDYQDPDVLTLLHNHATGKTSLHDTITTLRSRIPT
ncbi:ACP S-malonyltransferase [Actinokineospora inagensis]|uniref:ACP S-malonyltransferase n=1 Tax=Actinokineospora inagensis TaxID=103730 RepID=UPI000478E848|nr:ACP S-malonyltransferase [Actinokineospora inagensis]